MVCICYGLVLQLVSCGPHEIWWGAARLHFKIRGGNSCAEPQFVGSCGWRCLTVYRVHISSQTLCASNHMPRCAEHLGVLKCILRDAPFASHREPQCGCRAGSLGLAGNFSRLHTLAGDANDFNGTLPSDFIGNLTHIRTLTMSNNSFAGRWPMVSVARTPPTLPEFS